MKSTSICKTHLLIHSSVFAITLAWDEGRAIVANGQVGSRFMSEPCGLRMSSSSFTVAGLEQEVKEVGRKNSTRHSGFKALNGCDSYSTFQNKLPTKTWGTCSCGQQWHFDLSHCHHSTSPFVVSRVWQN